MNSDPSARHDVPTPHTVIRAATVVAVTVAVAMCTVVIAGTWRLVSWLLSG